MSDETQDRRVSERRGNPAPYDGPERRTNRRRAVDRVDLVTQAIARITDFRANFDSGALIDKRSELTADDLDLLIQELSIEPATWASIRIGRE